MNLLQRNCLLQNKNIKLIKISRSFIALLLSIVLNNMNAQVVNYVSNGGFEECVNCTNQPYIKQPKYWGAIDSLSYAFVYCGLKPPLANLPNIITGGFQYPKTGNNVIVSTIYCDYNTCPGAGRGFPRNRLKQKLKTNVTYCVKYYVNNCNCNTIAIDAFGAYFENETLDTIKYCTIPLTYFNPQVKNTPGNIIPDTLNWIPITGTFVANGSEKYLVLGNFKTNAATNTLLINPTFLPSLATDIYFDDVSCIELNLPAFAGRDTSVFTGDSLFVGRQPDVGIDEACIWYKLPGLTPIDTIAGFWIKPTETCTYVVRQEICGLVKWDTVRIYLDAVGVGNQNLFADKSKIYPNPIVDILNIDCDMTKENEKAILLLFDNLSRKVREEEITFINSHAAIKINELNNGVYVLRLNGKYGVLNKKVIVAR